MKIKLLLLSALLLIAANAQAQWKVTSVDRQDSQSYKPIQLVQLDSAVLIYGTLTNMKDYEVSYRVARETGVFVDGVKYKILNSVNLPVYDEAEKKSLILQPGQKANYVMAFEKFPLTGSFDLVENDAKHNDGMMNLYGIHTEKIDTTAIINTKKFLDSYPIVIYGSYQQNGKGYPYYLRDGVYVCVNADNRDDGKIFGPGDLMFNVEVINDSDHGILIDNEKIWITGHKKKKDGSEDVFTISKYSPESYERFLASQDYEAAKRATSYGLDKAEYLLRRESYNSQNSEWGKVGYSILSSLTEQMIENNVYEYLKKHPKTRPVALKSNSVKAGESINGFVACSKKKADYYNIHIKFDDYEFTFPFK